jgi:hypothetical protein
VPPVADTDAEPSEPPSQLTVLPPLITTPVINGTIITGSVNVIDSVPVHPFASVTVTV